MKKILIFLLLIFTLVSCKNENYLNYGSNKYYFHVNEENEKYLVAETYPANMYIELELNYQDYPELEIPKDLSEKEIESLKWNYNNQLYSYYYSKNDEILNQYGILDLDNEDWYISGYEQKAYFTYDLKYYHTTVETIIDQMKIDGVITSYNEKETYDVVSATRINPEYYELKKSNKIKIKHSFPSIYLGYDNISIDNYLYPNGIFYSEEEIMEAYNSREEAEGYTDYYLSRIEYFDFSSYVYIISSPFDTTDTEGFSYSMDITDVYLQDETLYCLYQKITRPNKVYSTTLSSEKTQIVIQIHKAYLRKNKDYKIVELY